MKNPVFKVLEEHLPGVQKNVLLKHHTTFNIGGPADYFFIAKKNEDVICAIATAKKIKVPFFIFGGGSNLLVSDKGLEGLVIKIQCTTWSLKQKNMIVSDAGVSMKDLVNFSTTEGLAGLEWAGGLPGTFGGAIRGNAGAFGGEIKDAILYVEALDNNSTLRKLSNQQCQFSYRSSIFKKKNWIVLSAAMRFKKGDKKNLKAVANAHIKYRKEKHPLEYPNAGSIFKNVDVKKISPNIQELFKDKVKKDPFLIVPAAWFVIGAGLAGKKMGRVQISKKHSNYMVNLGGAKAKDVIALIAFVKKAVKKKYGVTLEQEVQFLEN